MRKQVDLEGRLGQHKTHLNPFQAK